MKIYIVRHGQTEENQKRILQGHLPGTLTPEGKEQIRMTAERLSNENVSFRCILSSDLRRAMDSAEINADKLKLQIIPMKELRERDWGKYTGMPLADARDKFYSNGRWQFPDSAETEEEILNRAQNVLDKLKSEYPSGNIIIVTHGLFARNLIGAHLQCPYQEVSPFMNAEIRILKIKI